MPFPLFKRFAARKKAAATKAKATVAATTASAKKAARRAASSPTGREIRRNTQKLIEAGLRSLGKVGTLLNYLLRIGRATPDEALATINQAVAESGRQAPSRPTTTPPPRTTRPEPRRIEPPPEVEFRESPRPQQPGSGYQVRIGGRLRTYTEDDPTVSGEMIDVQSSNVHSIGFEFNWDNPMQGTLKVRFLQGSKDKKSAGPLYFYYKVHPDVFQAFRTAASKGAFVWDRLRIRGTVTGHRYKYELRGIVNGYVPRQAKKYGQNQYFVRRQIKAQRNGEVRTFESELPDQRRGTYRPANNGRPNNGRPSNGRRGS